MPVYCPIIALQDKYPALRRFWANNFRFFPSKPLQGMEAIIDVMDSTSRSIYKKKKLALMANDEELKLKVEEGKDLMSVLCKELKSLMRRATDFC